MSREALYRTPDQHPYGKQMGPVTRCTYSIASVQTEDAALNSENDYYEQQLHRALHEMVLLSER